MQLREHASLQGVQPKAAAHEPSGGGVEAGEVVLEKFDDPSLLVQRWEWDRKPPQVLSRNALSSGPGLPCLNLGVKARRVDRPHYVPGVDVWAPDSKNRHVHCRYSGANRGWRQTCATDRVRHPRNENVAGLKKCAPKRRRLIATEPAVRPIAELTDANIRKLSQSN